jgi:hypothetical protein
MIVLANFSAGPPSLNVILSEPGIDLVFISVIGSWGIGSI